MDLLIGLIGLWFVFTIIGSGLGYLAHLEQRCVGPDDIADTNDPSGQQ